MIRTMKWKVLFKFYFIILGVTTQKNDTENLDLTLPDELLIGVNTCAFQTEGAWNESGKSESIWDHYTHNHPERIADGSNIDVSANFYHKYKEDIQLVKSIGFDIFRFSISWSRIFPSGYAINPNPDGVLFYHNLLDELQRQGIIPFVTLYHFDHPQVLDDQLNGWLNESMAYAFSDYARFIFKEYGNRVKYFTTFYEPTAFCTYFYPKLVSHWNDNCELHYLCIHNALKAHALAYRIYDEEFRQHQRGQVGIIQACPHHYNIHNNDTLALEVAFEFMCGMASHPIFSETGDYSYLVKERVAARSRALGLKKSKLPVFTQEWIDRIRGSSDYFGLNHYTSFLVKSLPLSEVSKWENDAGITYSVDEKRPFTQITLMKIIPEGMRDTLKLIKKKYKNPTIFVTGTGVADSNGTNDNARINFIYSYAKEVLKAINEDKCNVKVFTLYSLLDVFEYHYGYTVKYGLIHVDFNDNSRKRTLKKSAAWLKLGLKSHKLLSPPPLD